MKKTLIALAVLAASTASMAQVTLYGVVDAGLVVDGGAPNGSTVKLGTGVFSSNRVGFKGREDLGGGTSMIFQLENGFNMDTGTLGQGGLFFGRQAFAGFEGSFGSVTLGRQYTPLSWAQYIGDPFEAGSSGASYNLMEIKDHRLNNTIRYQVKSNSGFLADVAYSFGEVTGNNNAGSTVNALVGYEAGPLSIKAGYSTQRNTADTKDTTKKLFAASYNFNILTAFLTYAENDGEGTYTNGATSGAIRAINNKDLLVGVSVPVGAGSFKLSYINRDDTLAANEDATQWAIGYMHPLSKRTTFYTTYARIENKNGAKYTVGNSSDAGTGDSQYNLGVKHVF